MTANLDRTDVNWVSKLPAIKLAYNSTVHSSTGVTPVLAFLGHEIKLPISLMIPAPEDQPSQHKWLSNLQETYTKIFGKMYSAQDQVNRTNAMLYSNKKAQFAVGTIVWYFASQHGLGPQQRLGTSPTQPPNPGNTSTPTQSPESTVGKDRLASKHIKPPSVQERPGYPSFVDDAVWTSSNTSRNLSTRPANLSAKDLQEVSDHLEALEVASQEYTHSRSGFSTPANSTPMIIISIVCVYINMK